MQYIQSYWGKDKNLIRVSQFQFIWHLRNHVVNLHQNKKVNGLLKVIQGHPALSGVFNAILHNLAFHPLFFKHLKLKHTIYTQLEIRQFWLKFSDFKLVVNCESMWKPTWWLPWIRATEVHLSSPTLCRNVLRLGPSHRKACKVFSFLFFFF